MDYERLRAFRNERNPFPRRLGIYVEELRPGYARAVKTVTEEDLNPIQVTHGGVYYTLADTACGSVMAAYGTMAVTINSAFSFLKSAQAGERLTAEARELPGGRSVCVLEVRVTGGEGELFATGTFTFRRLDKLIAF
ncbi:PaaI family thioesterase [uncultured Oscillibacter sp.]|jgi:acyl-CoA thioesterase|uniref:PaaI family thioesterase n=1 Tax=uncultured Oscillibacter sp. TaxID=876091 RepID=UPI0026022077|nr:PaaI family thioesterase [uncultured Oscillibacter sp.]